MSLFGTKPVLGFTGTQQGMTLMQLAVVADLMKRLEFTAFHHGDCIGSDHDAYLLVAKHRPDCRIVIHPPVLEHKCAFCVRIRVPNTVVQLPARHYIDRNHDIVRASTLMLATPAEKVEQLRSGTWATIRFARKLGIKLHVIYPDGTIVN